MTPSQTSTLTCRFAVGKFQEVLVNGFWRSHHNEINTPIFESRLQGRWTLKNNFTHFEYFAARGRWTYDDSMAQSEEPRAGERGNGISPEVRRFRLLLTDSIAAYAALCRSQFTNLSFALRQDGKQNRLIVQDHDPITDSDQYSQHTACCGAVRNHVLAEITAMANHITYILMTSLCSSSSSLHSFFLAMHPELAYRIGSD